MKQFAHHSMKEPPDVNGKRPDQYDLFKPSIKPFIFKPFNFFIMKKSTLFIALFITLFCFDSFATTWRVNNNPGINANFTTLQAAVNGAASGDTLIVEPSPNSYGGATINKKLTIIGNGSFLANNPGLQFNNNESRTSGIFFQAGSEGSFLSGIYDAGSIYIQASNITVTRCRTVGAYFYVYAGNLTIAECWTWGIIQQVDGLTNLLYRNNVIQIYITVKQNSIALIENNVIGWGGDGFSLGGSNSVVRNNIIPNNVVGGANADLGTVHKPELFNQRNPVCSL